MTDPKATGAALEQSPPGRPSVIIGLILACRPKQWSKNVLVFFGLIFALKLTDPHLVLRSLAAFAVFCAASSGVYLFNDLADVERDRQHPKKMHRPLAAGVITPSQAIALGVVLFVVAIAGAFGLGSTFGLLTVLYIALMSAYSIRLKHIVLIDTFVIAAGFVIRAAGGAVVVDVPISPWLYVCTVLASLFLGLGKRRSELITLSQDAKHHRRILDDYSIPLLDQLIVVVTSAIIMAYSLYTFSAENLPSNHSMMLTIPFVLYGLFRYIYLM
ncbi:MAG TPA: decaprenyl-phosphate phosphoribosyltransferase, partial [Chloroflexota bacterium]|nr:decaprenyl-phosphate phosphoribosyltransferase [Chloroflexota bacterium]